MKLFSRPFPNTSTRLWRACRSLAGLGLAIVMLPAAAQLRVVASVEDLYAPGGPQISTNSQNRPTTLGAATAEIWQPAGNGVPWSQGGLAFGRAEWNNRDLAFGVSALARSTGGFNGSATASQTIDFGVDVLIPFGSDPISVALLAALQPRCSGGCQLETSFLHTTRGRLTYANDSGDRRAVFGESLTFGSASVSGEVNLTLRNNSELAEVQTGGAWSLQDLTAFGPAPASQLGLYPTGDPRNVLEDPRGDLRGFEFWHTEVITLRLGFTLEGVSSLVAGQIPVQLSQLAWAGIGNSVFSSSTLSVDFADTTILSPIGLLDPTGELDLSPLALQFGQVTVVPEPASAAMLAAGWLLLWQHLRRRRAA